MKTIMSASFGLSLAASAFALTGAPASAFEAETIAATAPNSVIKVYDEDRREERAREERREERAREERREERAQEERRDRRQREARERSERCEQVRRECREDRGRGYEFRECVERRGC